MSAIRSLVIAQANTNPRTRMVGPRPLANAVIEAYRRIGGDALAESVAADLKLGSLDGAQPCRVGGRGFSSWKEAGRFYSRDHKTVQEWVERHGPERAMPAAKPPSGAGFRTGGVDYASAREAAAAWGIGRDAIRGWVGRHGPEVPYSAKTTAKTTGAKPIRVGGKDYRSEAEAGRAIGAEAAAARRWVEKWGTEKAYVRVSNKVAIRVGGVDYNSGVEAEQANGVRIDNLRRWVSQYGAEAPYQNRYRPAEPCRVGGVDYPSWAAAGNANSTKGEVVKRWAQKQGPDAPYAKPVPIVARPCRLGGVDYPSLSAAARMVDVRDIGVISRFIAKHGTEAPFRHPLPGIRVCGQNFRSWHAARHALGVGSQALKAWADKHGTETPYVNRLAQPFTVGGVTYKNRQAAAEELRAYSMSLKAWVTKHGTEKPYKRTTNGGKR